MSDALDYLEAMLAQYNEDSAPKPAASTNSGGYDAKNYFSERLPKGVDSGTFTIRILPPLQGKKVPYDSHNIHSWKIDGKYPKMVCRREIGEDCPVCDAREALYAEASKSPNGGADEKEAAKKFNSKKMYILRVIDRDKEEEGVKFWRFGHSYKKDGILDKIMAIVSTMGINPFDAETGQDLVINVARDSSMPAVCRVTAVLPKGPSRLSDDDNKYNTWLSDNRTWKDGIFKPKPYEYLKLVTIGKTPVWDKESKSYVSKEEMEEVEVNGGNAVISDEQVITMGGAPVQETVQDAPQPIITQTGTQVGVSGQGVTNQSQPVVEQPQQQVINTTPTVDEDDDLPF